MKFKYLLDCLLFSVACGVPAAPFTVSVDGQEVTDTKTGLIWRRCAEGMTASGGTCTGEEERFTQEEALTRAGAQAAATGVAWRLPNIKELSSIVDRSRREPAIDAVAFPATASSYCWSSTPSLGGAAFAFYVFFADGSVYAIWRDAGFGVRLVRAGQ